MAFTYLDHIQSIKEWQSSTGRTGSPPKDWNPTLSNWIQYARKRVRDGFNPEYQVELAALGIKCTAASSEATADALRLKPVKPRGLWESIDELQLRLLESRPPTFSDSDKLSQHLAVWLCRVQSGILASNHITNNDRAPEYARVSSFIQLCRARLDPAVRAFMWFEFCARTSHAIRRAKRGTGWHDAVAYPARSNFDPSSPMQLELKRIRELPPSEWPLIPHPISMIRAINGAFGSLDKPVSFQLDRRWSWEFARDFTEAGAHVTDDQVPFVFRPPQQ